MKLSRKHQMFIKPSAFEFIVMNVGQGNMNLIQTPKFNFFYDFGYAINATRSDLEIFLKNNKRYFEKDFAILISHWDLDHYQLLIALLESPYLVNLKYIIANEVIPNITVNRLILSLKKNLPTNAIHLIPCAKKESSVKGYENYYSKYSFQNIDIKKDLGLNKACDLFNLDIFRGGYKSDRNRYSIVLIINYYGHQIICTGDSHYKDVNKYVYSILEQTHNLSSKILYYMVPHHGGKAGRFVMDNLTFSRELSKFIISVGKNSYTHPRKDVIENLEMHINGNNILRTDKQNGDTCSASDKENTLSEPDMNSNSHLVFYSNILVCNSVKKLV